MLGLVHPQLQEVLVPQLHELIELELRKKVSSKLSQSLSFAEYTSTFVRELESQREALAALLVSLLDGSPPTTTATTSTIQTPIPVIRLPPTPEVLERAEKLQLLALTSPSDNERSAAWNAFEKLWQKYLLPGNLGMSAPP